jgi:hypothetical protein
MATTTDPSLSTATPLRPVAANPNGAGSHDSAKPETLGKVAGSRLTTGTLLSPWRIVGLKLVSSTNAILVTPPEGPEQ